jgi:hypothetical protein
MAERQGKINAAGGFLRAVNARRAGAQGAWGAAELALPVAQTLNALAISAPPDSQGVNVDVLAGELAVSRNVLAEALANLSQLDLVALMREGGEERARLTGLGATVVGRQRERQDGD